MTAPQDGELEGKELDWLQSSELPETSEENKELAERLRLFELSGKVLVAGVIGIADELHHAGKDPSKAPVIVSLDLKDPYTSFVTKATKAATGFPVFKVLVEDLQPQTGIGNLGRIAVEGIKNAKGETVRPGLEEATGGAIKKVQEGLLVSGALDDIVYTTNRKVRTSPFQLAVFEQIEERRKQKSETRRDITIISDDDLAALAAVGKQKIHEEHLAEMLPLPREWEERFNVFDNGDARELWHDTEEVTALREAVDTVMRVTGEVVGVCSSREELVNNIHERIMDFLREDEIRPETLEGDTQRQQDALKAIKSLKKVGGLRLPGQRKARMLEFLTTALESTADSPPLIKCETIHDGIGNYKEQWFFAPFNQE